MTLFRRIKIAMLGGILLAGLAPLAAGQAEQWQAPDVNEKNLKQWLDYVMPKAEELKWKEIGWRTSLNQAIEEAKDLQRPIFLWTMNGHPCGTV